MAEFETATGIVYYEFLSRPGDDLDDRPVLILLHNFTSTGRAAWGPLVDDLAEQFRILLPDLSGHGQSIGYPSRFHHLAMAHQIRQLMQSLGIDDCHLAACSSDGMIARLLAHHRLTRVASLTLVSTTYSVELGDAEGGRGLSPAAGRSSHRSVTRGTGRLVLAGLHHARHGR